MKVHTMFVIGKRDMEADAVSVRVHGKGNLGAKPRSEAIAEILLSIKDGGHNSAVKRFVPALVALAANLSLSSWADEQITDPSPDGRFAMLLTEDQKEEGRVRIQLIEVSSRNVVLELAESGHPHSERCKLLWAPDSQRVAFYEAHHRGGDTTVYFRNESGFIESPLPELGNCATAAEKKELKGKGVHKFIEANTAPKEWLKSGALVVRDDQGWETKDGNLRGCTQILTIAFDTNHKASIQRVADKKSKEY